MRRGNLPGSGYDKVTSKLSGDLLTTRCDKVSLWRGGDVPHWVFHLGLPGGIVGTYWWDVVDMYHWDVLMTYQWDVVGCFIWDFSETSSRRTDETALLCPLETLARHSNNMSWIRTAETSWRGFIERSFECFIWDVPATSLGRTKRRHYDVFTTSFCRVGKFCFGEAHFIWKRK